MDKVGFQTIHKLYTPQPFVAHGLAWDDPRTLAVYDRLMQEDRPVVMTLLRGACPITGTKDPNAIKKTLDYLSGKGYRLDFLNMDFELDGGWPTARNNAENAEAARQVRTHPDPNINQAYIGQYDLYPCNSIEWTPDPADNTQAKADEFNAAYVSTGMNVAMPSMYGWEYYSKHASSDLWGDNIAPSTRSAIFWGQLAKYSNAKLNLPAGHLLIPYMCDFVPCYPDTSPYNAPTPPHEDSAAVLKHARLRGADGYFIFATHSQKEPKPYDNDEYRGDMLNAWEGLDWLFAGGHTPTILNLTTDKKSGLQWSGTVTPRGVAILVSNLGNSAVQFTMPNVPGFNDQLIDEFTIKPGEHRLEFCQVPKPATVKLKAVKSLCLILPPHPGLVVENIGRVFTRQIQSRCAAKVVAQCEAPLRVELAVEPGIGTEGFRIADGAKGTIRIIGNDDRGLLYGVGKFLRTSRYDQGGFTAGNWRGASVPKRAVRGVYLATHFHNFYHDAPIEEVQRYIEDLGLWGYNSVMVWNNLSDYDGFDDPKAVEFRRRLRAICEAATGIGLGTSWGVVNEGYNNSPVSLRAQKEGGARGAWIPCVVCPSKPEGMKYILDVCGEMCDWWADLRTDYFFIWPYDYGGCGCKQCRPWGSNGYLKMGEPLATLARRKMPGVKIVLSTWYFDDNERQAMAKKFSEQRPWADYIIAEGTCPTIGGLPVIGFPEISMHKRYPWGGYGATLLPQHFQAQWNAVKSCSHGGFPYSEGIYEDIQKAIFSQFYWKDRPAEETLREYIAFEYAPTVVDEVMRVFAILEQNHSAIGSSAIGTFLDEPREIKPNRAEEAYKTLESVDAKLTPQARQAWRWRQLYLRALIDVELTKNHNLPNDRCQEAFAELIEIYHVHKGVVSVRPPLDAKFRSQKQLP